MKNQIITVCSKVDKRTKVVTFTTLNLKIPSDRRKYNLIRLKRRILKGRSSVVEWSKLLQPVTHTKGEPVLYFKKYFSE